MNYLRGIIKKSSFGLGNKVSFVPGKENKFAEIVSQAGFV
jgi:hypothetical protein